MRRNGDPKLNVLATLLLILALLLSLNDIGTYSGWLSMPLLKPSLLVEWGAALMSCISYSIWDISRCKVPKHADKSAVVERGASFSCDVFLLISLGAAGHSGYAFLKFATT